MRKTIVLPAVAAVGGLAGFVLRRMQWSTGFEPGTGLPVPGNVPALLLIVLSFVVAAAMFLLCRGGHREFSGYDDAFLTHSPTLRAFSNAAVPCLTVAGAWKVQELLLTDWPVAQLSADGKRGLSVVLIYGNAVLPAVVCIGFCLCSAVAILLTVRNNYWGDRKGTQFRPLLVPAFGSCLWLILTYRQRSNDPVTQAYAYQILAIVCVCLALYQIATFSFSKKNSPAAALFFSLMAVYFSLICLADMPGLIPLLLYLSCMLYLGAQAAILLHNDARLPWPLPPVRPNEDDDEDEED